MKRLAKILGGICFLVLASQAYGGDVGYGFDPHGLCFRYVNGVKGQMQDIKVCRLYEGTSFGFSTGDTCNEYPFFSNGTYTINGRAGLSQSEFWKCQRDCEIRGLDSGGDGKTMKCRK
ncbi:MAG: hypothetical protein AB7O96_19590 [Pseudobdellovibrionaceae bacterium]